MTKAYRLSSYLSETKYYTMVDADSDILDNFDLNKTLVPEKENSFLLYQTKNPVNELIYGYGGIKVCPTQNFRNITNDELEPIFSGGINSFSVVRHVASYTRFNTSKWNAWKAGFREAAMLAARLDTKKDNEVRTWLTIWKTKGSDKPFGQFVIDGAVAGEVYGRKNRNSIINLQKINDPHWLRLEFTKYN
jgi:hypothetical protein